MTDEQRRARTRAALRRWAGWVIVVAVVAVVGLGIMLGLGLGASDDDEGWGVVVFLLLMAAYGTPVLVVLGLAAAVLGLCAWRAGRPARTGPATAPLSGPEPAEPGTG